MTGPAVLAQNLRALLSKLKRRLRDQTQVASAVALLERLVYD